MATSSAVTGTTGATTSGTSSTSSSTTLGKEDFLRLLTAQLANQDPLEPVDNQAFVAQLAQFSSLESLQNVSSQLETLLVAAASQTQLNTTSLVGKTVTYSTDELTVATAGAAPSTQVKLEAAGTVTALIQNENGTTVRALALGSRQAGSFDLAWDGRDASGNPVAAGTYTIDLSAVAPDGTDVAVEARVTGLVTGVSYDGDAAELLVGGDAVAMADVVQVAQP